MTADSSTLTNDKPLASVSTRCVHSLIFISPEYRPPTYNSTAHGLPSQHALEYRPPTHNSTAQSPSQHALEYRPPTYNSTAQSTGHV